MSDLRMYEFDAITGEGSYRDLTAEELKEHKANEKLRAEALVQAEAKAQAKVVAEGKLAALGLTTDDLRALGF